MSLGEGDTKSGGVVSDVGSTHEAHEWMIGGHCSTQFGRHRSVLYADNEPAAKQERWRFRVTDGE